jgi:predicted ribosomally synthesized peptide with SipW-like signal peptide
MKKILGLSVVAMMIMAMVGGGTWAYFSDPEQSTGNTFTAGALNMILTVDGEQTVGTGSFAETAGGDGLDGNVQFGELEPGDQGSITWVLVNDSDISADLTIESTPVFTDGVAANEPEGNVSDPHANNGGGDGDLDEFVGVKLQRGVGADQTAAEAAFTYILGDASYYAEMSQMEAILDAEAQTMAADGGNDTIVYKLTFLVETDITDAGTGTNYLFGDGVEDGTADDNIIQGDTCTLGIVFTLTQS